MSNDAYGEKRQGAKWTLCVIGGTLVLALMLFAIRAATPPGQAADSTATGAAGETASAQPEPKSVKALFPFTLNAADVEGHPVSLEDMRGKVVIITLWGTWCGPCRMEIPHLIKLKNTYESEGLEVVGINFEQTRSPSEALALVKKARTHFKLNYPCIIGTREIYKQVPNMQGFPTTLIIDREGRVRYLVDGYHPYQEFEGVVLSLLKTQ